MVIGIVKDTMDPEREGRVKVTFPWFDGETVSEWCRVSQLLAGSGYGSLFVPEEETEVLIGFSHGDMRIPIVLGGLYNGQDKPPTHGTSSKEQRMLRTRGGHQMVFDDSAAGKKVELTSSANQSMKLDCMTQTMQMTSANVAIAASKVAIAGMGGGPVGIALGGDLAVDPLIKGMVYRTAETLQHQAIVSALGQLISELTAMMTSTPALISPTGETGRAVIPILKALSQIIAAIGTFEAGSPGYLSMVSKTA